MFVVAGVSGQTGAAVAQALLDRSERVRVLVRTEERGAVWKAKGARVSVSSLDDAGALAAALEGARGAYLIVPPCYEAPEPNTAACRVVDAYRAALERVQVGSVVVLSSIGAQHSEKTGLIIPCHYAEQQLGRLTETRCTFLRSAYFMENLPSFMGAIREEGVLPVLFSPSLETPMVSVQDIGQFVADTLTESVLAHQVVELAGPTEPSFEEVAALFSKALGTPVNAVQVPEGSIIAALIRVGMSAPTAALYREMALAVGAGLVAFERGPVRQVKGTVSIEEAVRRFTC